MAKLSTIELWKKVRVFPAWLILAEALLLIATFLLPIFVRATNPLAQLVFQLAFMIMLTLFMATLTTWMVAWSVARALIILSEEKGSSGKEGEEGEGAEKKAEQ